MRENVSKAKAEFYKRFRQTEGDAKLVAKEAHYPGFISSAIVDQSLEAGLSGIRRRQSLRSLADHHGAGRADDGKSMRLLLR